jgi:hypothetical protein
MKHAVAKVFFPLSYSAPEQSTAYLSRRTLRRREAEVFYPRPAADWDKQTG